MELLECVGHGSKTHGIRPYCLDDFIDDHGSGFEQFGHDGVPVVQNGASFEVVLLALSSTCPDGGVALRLMPHE